MNNIIKHQAHLSFVKCLSFLLRARDTILLYRIIANKHTVDDPLIYKNGTSPKVELVLNDCQIRELF